MACMAWRRHPLLGLSLHLSLQQPVAAVPHPQVLRVLQVLQVLQYSLPTPLLLLLPTQLQGLEGDLTHHSSKQ